jgi:hypothetical protein
MKIPDDNEIDRMARQAMMVGFGVVILVSFGTGFLLGVLCR